MAQTYVGPGGTIPDDGNAVDFTIIVSDPALDTLLPAYGLLRLCIEAEHTWDSDLNFSLIAPDGTTLEVITGVGGDGDDFTGTCLEDNAATSIASVGAPFTGTFKPMGPLGDANNGGNGNGTWTLHILDTYAFADAGTLFSWSITFGPNATGPMSLDSTNLPILLINTFGNSIPNDPKIPATLSIIDHAPLQNHPTDVANVYNGHMGIEQRGNFSAIFPQKPYGIELRDSTGAELDSGLFGLPPEHDWVLLAMYNDKALLRNPLAYQLFREMGHWAPNTRLCEVMLNGTYRGIYAVVEKIKRDPGRVDIAKLDSTENAGDDLTGGYMFKVDYWDGGNSWLGTFNPIDHPTLDVHYVYDYPKPEDITPTQQSYIQDVVEGFESALYGSDFSDSLAGYRAWIDTRSFIDYFLLNEVARNIDGFKKSRWWHKDKDSNGGLIKAGPVWDFDWAWKNIYECNGDATDGSGWAYQVNDCNPDVNSPGWEVRLLQDSSFRVELRCRYEELRQTIFSTGYLNSFIDSIAVLTADARSRHFVRYPVFNGTNGTPEVQPIAVDYDDEVQRQKDWIALRLSWLDDNLPGTCTGMGIGPLDAEVVVRAFPNPACERFYIESGSVLGNISVFDASGRAVHHELVQGHRAILDCSDWSAGAYQVVIATERGPVVRRSIVRAGD